jgi:hypothetical protein
MEVNNMTAFRNGPETGGYIIAERFHGRDNQPAVMMRAWFSILGDAEDYMRAATDQTNLHRRISDAKSGKIVSWRGIIYQVDPVGAPGPGENALSLEDWLAFADQR